MWRWPEAVSCRSRSPDIVLLLGLDGLDELRDDLVDVADHSEIGEIAKGLANRYEDERISLSLNWKLYRCTEFGL